MFFFNELSKRELGRNMCSKNGCTHFMSMDADEFYKSDQLKKVMSSVIEDDLDGTFCFMRIFFKQPIFEYLKDDVNCVSLIYKIKDDMKFRLAEPVANLIVDPTRKLCNLKKIRVFPRKDVEMYHYSFVRRDIKMKLQNVSNRSNYENDMPDFYEKFESWEPSKGILHPHPHIGNFFKSVAIVDNFFNIDINSQCNYCFEKFQSKKCGKCKKVVYCGALCQKKDWPFHKSKCFSD